MLRAPMQPAPLKAGSTKIVRKWNFWSSSEPHEVHFDQGESLQSRLSQSASHAIVALSTPEQGLPHSLLSATTVRERSQRPSHFGLLHSDHWLISQSWGTQFSVQGELSSQSWTSTCLPWQSLSTEPTARGSSGFLSVLTRARRRKVKPEPQVLEHGAQVDHFSQTQYRGFVPQLWSQTRVSFVASMVHSLPSFSGTLAIGRCRNCSPPHCVQCPHSDQSPYSQSTLLPHLSVLQGFVMIRAPEQRPATSFVSFASACGSASSGSSLPPPSQLPKGESLSLRPLGPLTRRVRTVWLPPHVTGHAYHSSHSPSMQMMSGSSLQLSSRQLSSSSSGLPSRADPQVAPPPWRCTSISRERFRVPAHLSVHEDHWDHALSRQSTSPAQAMFVLHSSASEARPIACFPQLLASRSSVRWWKR
mmetsp:Transcript_60554/g.190341  ORF Transcript_60554/g.190341 Transcript_60554/m.190341 type:complete len:417 (-) Transcript_60554:338-1588(-)